MSKYCVSLITHSFQTKNAMKQGLVGWIGAAIVVLLVVAIAMRIDFIRSIILPTAAVTAAAAGK